MLQAARLAEIEANRMPVYEDKPIIARGWQSETAAETAREVKDSGHDPPVPWQNVHWYAFGWVLP